MTAGEADEKSVIDDVFSKSSDMGADTAAPAPSPEAPAPVAEAKEEPAPQEIVKAEAQKEIVDVFKTFLLNAYGEKSDDGRKHKKTQELKDDFASSAAYAAFYMQLAEDADLAARFINGVVPKGMAQELTKEI